MSETDHGCTSRAVAGAVSIVCPDGSGQVVSRMWNVCSCTVGVLTAIIGRPASEALFTPDAAHEVGRLIAATPGVVITSQETP